MDSGLKALVSLGKTADSMNYLPEASEPKGRDGVSFLDALEESIV